MRNLLFSLVFLFSVNVFADPKQLDPDVRRFINETLNDDAYRKQILNKMHVLIDDFSKSHNKKAAEYLEETIYYIENRNMVNMPEYHQNIVLIFIKNV